MKILTVCGAGVGSSLMLKLYVQQVLDQEGIAGEVESTDIGSVSDMGVDIIITTTDLANTLRNTKAKVIALDNLTDKQLLRDKLLSAI